MKASEYDVVIIGAGPSGTAAAALLQREGFRLLVVEKQVFPRFVIGESLLPYSMELLKETGLLEAVEARGFMQKRGAVFWRGQQTCNFDFSQQSSAGWQYTYQVPRAEFDQTLAEAVAARGVEIRFGHGVTAVAFDESGATVTIEQPDKVRHDVRTRFVLDCSGFGRVLPRLLDLEVPATSPVRESIFTHVSGDRRPPGREEGKVWICMHEAGAWIWIIPFSDGRTSVGVVAEPEFFRQHGADADAQLRSSVRSEPNAAARLADMKILFPPQRISGYACGVKRLWGPHYALTGNATEFLDPIFSSGVTLALESSLRACRVLTRELRGETVDWEADYAAHVKRGIETFRAYVSAWYEGTLPEIFFAAGSNRDIMRQICSVLAGYVWDESNPYVTQPARALPLLAKVVEGLARSAKP